MKQYQIDTFTEQLFKGNPAAVVPLEQWLDEALMQSIAMENNLSETAFFVPVEGGYQLRWFTPVCEVDLCGHATLAAAYVLFYELGYQGESLCFYTRSGELSVIRRDHRMEMNFPVQVSTPCIAPLALLAGLGVTPVEVYVAEDYLVVLESEQQLQALQPDFAKLLQLDCRGVVVTAPGEKVDFVSRFFAPKAGINEDPVTGSAHCQLVPYWSEKTAKCHFHAKQLSDRGGELWCQLEVDRVIISGYAVKYMEAELNV